LCALVIPTLWGATAARAVVVFVAAFAGKRRFSQAAARRPMLASAATKAVPM
jgi:hypothetical protein